MDFLKENKDKILLWTYAALGIFTYIIIIATLHTFMSMSMEKAYSFFWSVGVVVVNYATQILFWRKFLSTRK